MRKDEDRDGCKCEMPTSRLIMTVTHRHDNSVREQLEAIGISRATGPVLFEVSHHPGISQSELAKMMNFRASSISVTIQKLCDAGFIRKAESKTDARVDCLYLTEAGKEKQLAIRETFARAEREFLAPLNEEEQKQLRELLQKLR